MDKGLVTISKRAGDVKHAGKLAFGCHGHGRGCKRNKHRRDPAPCEDCVKGRQEATLAQIIYRKATGL